MTSAAFADNPEEKSTAEQTKSILSKINGFLAKAGIDKSKLLSANIWITDMANFAELNVVWDAQVPPGKTPARPRWKGGSRLLTAAHYKRAKIKGGRSRAILPRVYDVHAGPAVVARVARRDRQIVGDSGRRNESIIGREHVRHRYPGPDVHDWLINREHPVSQPLPHQRVPLLQRLALWLVASRDQFDAAPNLAKYDHAGKYVFG